MNEDDLSSCKKYALTHLFELHLRANFYGTFRGVMESIYTELALYGNKNECAMTDIVFLPISEVCNGTVSLLLLICDLVPVNPFQTWRGATRTNTSP